MVGVSHSTASSGPQRVAVVIAARDDRETIPATVRACYAIPDVDLIVVVDDGSDDDTAHAARGAGAVVVRHSVPRGRASALETGVKVVAMRDRVDWPARHLLFLDPNLGDSAVEATALVDAVNSKLAACAIGVIPEQTKSGRRGAAEKAAYKTIRGITGWLTFDPLSSDRCLTREAVNAIMPFSTGLAVDVAMTVDLISLGFTVVEIPCAFEFRGEAGRRDNYAVPRRSDIWWTVRAKRLRSRRIRRADRLERLRQGLGIPYGMVSGPTPPPGDTDEAEPPPSSKVADLS